MSGEEARARLARAADDLTSTIEAEIIKGPDGARHVPATVRRALFAVVRTLAAAFPSPDAARAMIRAFAARLPIGEWNEHLPPSARMTSDGLLGAAMRAWPKVRSPMGCGPFDLAIKRAVHAPVPAWVTDRGYDGTTALLIALCAELQRDADSLAEGDGAADFYLAVRPAADALHVGRTVAGDLLLLLCRDGILALVEPGGRHRGRKPAASRYRFIGPIQPPPEPPGASHDADEGGIPF